MPLGKLDPVAGPAITASAICVMDCARASSWLGIWKFAGIDPPKVPDTRIIWFRAWLAGVIISVRRGRYGARGGNIAVARIGVIVKADSPNRRTGSKIREIDRIIAVYIPCLLIGSRVVHIVSEERDCGRKRGKKNSRGGSHKVLKKLLAAVRQDRQGSDFQHLHGGWGWGDGELLSSLLLAIVENRLSRVHRVAIIRSNLKTQRKFGYRVDPNPFVHRPLNPTNR